MQLYLSTYTKETKKRDKKTAYGAKTGTIGAVCYACWYSFNGITTKLFRHVRASETRTINK